MGSLKTARGSNEPFKHNLILAKIIFFLMILAEIKLRLNGSLDPRAVLSDPMAFDPIYLHKYFHIFIYFIHQVIAYFSKHVARAIATLFHAHQHGNSRNVTKASNDIGMEGEEAAQEGIICRHTRCKLKQFPHKQIDEGVCIPWLFWTGYDSSSKDVVLLEVLVWREIVVENEKDPCGMLLLFEWSEAISGKAKCNITTIQEVIVG